MSTGPRQRPLRTRIQDSQGCRETRAGGAIIDIKTAGPSFPKAERDVLLSNPRGLGISVEQYSGLALT